MSIQVSLGKGEWHSHTYCYVKRVSGHNVVYIFGTLVYALIIWFSQVMSCIKHLDRMRIPQFIAHQQTIFQVVEPELWVPLLQFANHSKQIHGLDHTCTFMSKLFCFLVCFLCFLTSRISWSLPKSIHRRKWSILKVSMIQKSGMHEAEVNSQCISVQICV